MQQVTNFTTQHEDLLHDVCWDFYGVRLATCSSDQCINVWEKHPDSPSLVLNDSWQAHDCSVLKVRWAHPEFGNLVISSSLDRTVKIWEEQQDQPAQLGKRWKEKARLVDSKGTVLDVQFAPRHLGLTLATVAEDGIVRIYQAKDVTDVGCWALIHEFEATGKILDDVEEYLERSNAGEGNNKSFCLAWCPSRYQFPMMAISSGGVLRIFYQDKQNRWGPRQTIRVATLLRDLAWAPNMGRNYELIAGGGKDHRVRIWKLFDQKFHFSSLLSSPSTQKQLDIDQIRLEYDEVGNFAEHEAEVWRVSWNVTGTTLASSGDDGKVYIWKAAYGGQWKNYGIIHSGERNNVKPSNVKE